MEKEMKIQITDEISKIICKNLSGKTESFPVEIKSCKKCRYHDKPWIWGSPLHCCSKNSDNPLTSRDINELYDNCPIDHTIQVTKSYIKKYGIIHSEPKGDRRYYKKGSIAVVDFSGTTFEWDGYNPDIDWENVVVFYYNNQKEADIMMELALDYYHRFNLDDEWVEKRCYG